MKRRRHLIGGFLLILVGLVLVVAEWAVVHPDVAAGVAALIGSVGLANVAVGVGRPARVRARTDAVETATYLGFSLLGLVIVAENSLAPDGPGSYFHAALWGSAAVACGWLGIRRLRSGRRGAD